MQKQYNKPDTAAKYRLKIFVDFDGTISATDVGAEMFRRFGDPVKVDAAMRGIFERESVGIKGWQELFESLQQFDDEAYNAFLQEMHIEPSFKEFLAFAADYDFDVFILSDGFDYYIRRILEREGLGHLPLFSNRMRLENNRPALEFPHQDEECRLCANCKRNHILLNSADDDYTVFVGDGISDFCASQYCDFIFAKDDLLRHCEINRVTYFPYKDFHDVIKRLQKLMYKRWLKKRHQATMKRRTVYMQG